MNYNEIDPQQAMEAIQQDSELVVLDVREQDEYDAAHIEGVKLIPLGELPDRVDELSKDQRILCVCAGGVRSDRACQFLSGAGFHDVTNMSEGMKGWLKRGLPAVTD